ncbi:MAG: hypothetical protein KGO05_04965, partial [Chloroflexota bacterium]|nr:hypothetical protein [Chloroflexota bacterium]
MGSVKRLWMARGRLALLALAMGALLCAWSLRPATASALAPRDPTPTATISATATTTETAT